VIDPHVFVSRSGETWLFWKADTNAVWPSLLCALLHREPRLGGSLFASDEDRRTARLYSGLWPSIAPLPPMERFSALQLLIEAATADYSGLKGRLAAHPEIVEAMRTPILGRRLDSDTLSLAGDEVQVLENDLAWEGPLIEGMCLIERDGRYFLFYSGNDFSTAEYGIGYAVADWVEGPYRKRREPLVRSNAQWWGPGHPSIAQGPDGEPILFMHAYPPGKAAYKAFRALLAAGLRFDGERVEIVPPAL
jgi:hypothetical protein